MTDVKPRPKGKPKAKKPKISPDKVLTMTSTPAEEINPENIRDLRPAGYNPRVISTEQQEVLQRSMKEYGDIGGIVFNTKTGRTVGGHQRVKQLDPNWQIVKEPHTDETGTVAIGYIQTPHGRFNYREVAWSETKEKGANIAANKMGGAFDDEMLAALLQDLDQSGYDMSLTGFDDAELKALLGEDEEEGLGPEDPDVEPVEEPFVKLGDLWLLGESRLLCGDSTSLADVDKLMMGEKADMLWSDPPYNIAYETKAGKIDNDNLNEADFRKFLDAVFSSVHHLLKKGGCFYIAHAEGGGVGDVFRAAICGTKGLMWKQCLIWVKNAAVLARSDYNNKHEPILYGWKEGAAHYFAGDFTQTTVIDDDLDLGKMDKKKLIEMLNERRNAEPTTIIRIDKPAKSDIHPTMKPVRLVERNLRSSSRPGEVVVDLFSGSGTTIITCRKTGRKGRAMEFSPGYAQASLKRYQEYCHEEPLLVGPNGKLIPFSEVEKQRAKK